MPLFSWMKWSHETRVQTQDEEAPLKTTGVVPSRRLIRELLWHMEDREQLARELEREHRLANSSMGVQWFQTNPRLQTLIPTSELYQLEFLCAQIPPIHAATVLYRFREVLATNNIRPWELASVFKQVLRDFVNEEDDLSVQPAQLPPMEAWTSRYKIKQGFVTPTVPNCGDRPREEIPTISGYVDRAMRHSSSFTANWDWDLPYYHPVSLRPKGAYSTTL
ncbi:protein RD3-like [Scophthalmus maximus]|uniref:protein RD3-like n=1 Tax=Scophthalmus maximus TaxID=52904 RepID=UPI001FA8A91A|nr:protein RD3-like [Scophthalmus maximus]